MKRSAAKLLNETLNEEKAADDKLTEIAKNIVNAEGPRSQFQIKFGLDFNPAGPPSRILTMKVFTLHVGTQIIRVIHS
ncbi:MAG TPA: DUF892 family protein [Verrucomicrobiae bacterium]|nr:DUF892 family protein [Verrucomicrobiae bacterium]